MSVNIQRKNQIEKKETIIKFKHTASPNNSSSKDVIFKNEIKPDELKLKKSRSIIKNANNKNSIIKVNKRSGTAIKANYNSKCSFNNKIDNNFLFPTKSCDYKSTEKNKPTQGDDILDLISIELTKENNQKMSEADDLKISNRDNFKNTYLPVEKDNIKCDVGNKTNKAISLRNVTMEIKDEIKDTCIEDFNNKNNNDINKESIFSSQNNEKTMQTSTNLSDILFQPETHVDYLSLKPFFSDKRLVCDYNQFTNKNVANQKLLTEIMIQGKYLGTLFYLFGKGNLSFLPYFGILLMPIQLILFLYCYKKTNYSKETIWSSILPRLKIILNLIFYIIYSVDVLLLSNNDKYESHIIILETCRAFYLHFVLIFIQMCIFLLSPCLWITLAYLISHLVVIIVAMKIISVHTNYSKLLPELLIMLCIM